MLDTTGGAGKLVNAERLVKAIRLERFSELELLRDESFRQADGQATATEMLDRYRSDPFSIWYIAETHAKVNKLTRWVRERLHSTKSPESLMVGDLLEIYVTPFSKDADGNNLIDSIIPSGSRRSIASVGDRISYAQQLKGHDIPIRFHSVPCDLTGIEGRSLDVLEEFLIAEKPELSADTAIAIKVWKKQFEKRKEIPRPFSYARYGYASTVHHAQGMSRPICYVNCDHAAGRH